MLTPQPASATHHNLRRHPNLRSYTLSMSCAAILPAQPPHTTVPGPLLLYRLPSDALAHPPQDRYSLDLISHHKMRHNDKRHNQ